MIGTVAETHGSAPGIDLWGVASATQELEEHGPELLATWTGPHAASSVEPNGSTAFTSDRSHRLGARRAFESIESIGKDVRREVVVAGRERDRNLPVHPSIQLGWAAGTWPGPAAATPVFGIEQPRLDEPIEMECREFAAHSERGSCIVTTDRLAAGGHEVVQTLAVRLFEQGNCPDRFAGR